MFDMPAVDDGGQKALRNLKVLWCGTRSLRIELYICTKFESERLEGLSRSPIRSLYVPFTFARWKSVCGLRVRCVSRCSLRYRTT